MKLQEEQENLANYINDTMYDYDTYEYNDIYSSKEEGYNEVLELLQTQEGVNELKKFIKREIDLTDSKEDKIKFNNINNKIKTYNGHLLDLERSI